LLGIKRKRAKGEKEPTRNGSIRCVLGKEGPEKRENFREYRPGKEKSRERDPRKSALVKYFLNVQKSIKKKKRPLAREGKRGESRKKGGRGNRLGQFLPRPSHGKKKQSLGRV